MAIVDGNLVLAHRCAVMLSAAMQALNSCYWLQDYWFWAFLVVLQHVQLCIYVTEGKNRY